MPGFNIADLVCTGHQLQHVIIKDFFILRFRKMVPQS